VSKTKDKVPILGDLPLLGKFFRSEAARTKKKNLVIFVTPTIIDPAGNPVHTPDNLPYDPNAVPPQTQETK
jgi:general secretion pathway protein D